MRNVVIALGFVTIVMVAGCARTTVHRVSGDILRGKLVHSSPESVVIETRARDKLPVETASGDVLWRNSVEIAWVDIRREDIQLLKREDKVALNFAIASSVVSAVGLIALGPTIKAAESCNDPGWLGCLEEELAPIAVGSLALTGALVAIPSWIAWGASRKNERGPVIRPGLGGFSGTF